MKSAIFFKRTRGLAFLILLWFLPGCNFFTPWQAWRTNPLDSEALIRDFIPIAISQEKVLLTADINDLDDGSLKIYGNYTNSEGTVLRREFVTEIKDSSALRFVHLPKLETSQESGGYYSIFLEPEDQNREIFLDSSTPSTELRSRTFHLSKWGLVNDGGVNEEGEQVNVLANAAVLLLVFDLEGARFGTITQSRIILPVHSHDSVDVSYEFFVIDEGGLGVQDLDSGTVSAKRRDSDDGLYDTGVPGPLNDPLQELLERHFSYEEEQDNPEFHPKAWIFLELTNNRLEFSNALANPVRLEISFYGYHPHHDP